MNVRRWFSPIASAAAITLLGSLTALAVEGGDAEGGEVAPVAEVRQVVEEGPEESTDLIFEVEVDTGNDDVDEGGGRPGDAPDNHGQTVSEFARSTELTGCEKGHAISAVARGADPADPQSSDLYKPCTADEGEDVLGSDADDGSEAGPGQRAKGHAKAHGAGHAKATGRGHAKHMAGGGS